MVICSLDTVDVKGGVIGAEEPFSLSAQENVLVVVIINSNSSIINPPLFPAF